jgi:hypothetical protein
VSTALVDVESRPALDTPQSLAAVEGDVVHVAHADANAEK